MHYLSCIAITIASLVVVAAAPSTYRSQRRAGDVNLLTDLATISQYWGQISPYFDNVENYFGVKDVGLPSGCQVEQAHLLQRHANRFPTGLVVPQLIEFTY